MRRLVRIDRLAVPAVLALALLGTACNVPGNRPTDSEAIIHGTAIGYSGTSAADTTSALTATITFSVIARNQGGVTQSPLNAVQFETYTITFTSPSAFTATVPMQGVWYTVGSTGNTIILTLVPSPPAPTKVAGTVINAHVTFAGHDDLGRPVSYDVDLGTAVTS